MAELPNPGNPGVAPFFLSRSHVHIAVMLDLLGDYVDVHIGARLELISCSVHIGVRLELRRMLCSYWRQTGFIRDSR